MRYLPAIVLALTAVSCNRQTSEEVTRFHEDGRAKPIVAVASMIDTTSFDAAWSLSEEFTSTIQNQLAQTGQIFVRAQEDFPFTENPFGTDLRWMKKEFGSQEFVVFLELVKHEMIPRGNKNLPPQEISSNLEMKIRIRVIDLRPANPKIVLQEMIQDSFFIPKSLFPTDYSRIVWGTEEYRKSPMGIAHAQISSEIVNRVNDYILLAKSR